MVVSIDRIDISCFENTHNVELNDMYFSCNTFQNLHIEFLLCQLLSEERMITRHFKDNYLPLSFSYQSNLQSNTVY